MSTSVTQEKPVAGRPNKGLGLAAAGLAIVVAIGIGFTLSEDNAASPADVQRAHPQVTDSRRVKAENIAERDAVSPGANVEAYKVSQGIVGGQTESFSPEAHRVQMAKAATELDTLAKRLQAYVEFQEQVQKTGNGEVASS
jgi:formate dehydrogenase assembly factor FdhD